MAFTKELPEWQNKGQKPSNSAIQNGYQEYDYPPASWHNWKFNRTFEALKELQDKSVDKTSDFNLLNTTVTAGGSAEALTATVENFDYEDGNCLQVKLPVDISDNVTLNVNGLGSKPILTVDGSPMSSGAKAGAFISLAYNRLQDCFYSIGTAGSSAPSVEIKDIVYDNLKNLKDNNLLGKGNKYRIIDFRTIYRKPNGCDASGNDLWLTDGRATDPNPSIVEPLIVTAVNDNAFAAIAVSELYPEDVIYFSFDEDMRNNKGYEIYDYTHTKGFIYRRISKNKIDMPFDFRNVKWRRWEVDYAAIPQWNTTATYSAGAVVRNNGTANNIVYLAARNVSANQNPTGSTGYWQPILNLSQTKYWAPTNYDNNTAANNAWDLTYGGNSGSAYFRCIVPLTGAYRDTFTFTKYDGTPEPNLDKTLCRNNSVRSGYNFVFYSNGNNFHYNTIGNNFYNNTIGNNSSNNTVGNNFSLNTISDFSRNTIGNDFFRNTIGNSFSNNTIGNSFGSNTIGNDFSRNTIGNNFGYNTIGNSFYNNTIDNGSYNNTIGNNFHNNTIGNGFNYNTISHGFNYNTIGNSFEYNTIDNSFYYNTIGNSFYKNTIGNNFDDNTIGNGFKYNTIGSTFFRNTIGNGFDNSAIGNNFQYNTILDGGWFNWAAYNFTSASELYNRNYPHTIQLTTTGSIMVTWHADSVLQTMLLSR